MYDPRSSGSTLHRPAPQLELAFPFRSAEPSVYTTATPVGTFRFVCLKDGWVLLTPSLKILVASARLEC